MQAYHLIPHPSCSPDSVASIEARVRLDDPNWLQLRWRIEGASELLLPRITGKRRAEGLWQTTCFELFLRPEGGEGYVEWNLSPSCQWNAYAFDSYRGGMREADADRAPDCTMRPGSALAIFDAAIPRAQLPTELCDMGLSAVIEEASGTKTYWALAHPTGEKPDFHDPACFAAKLDPRTST